jgi:hypothetical protein
MVVSLIIGCKKDNPTAGVPNTPADTPHVRHPDTTKLALTNHYYTPGNLYVGGMDTFTLEFNQPVKINYVSYLNSGCLPDFKYDSSNSKNVIKFYNFLCGGLGKEYSFKYSITDTLGNQLIDSTTFFCYTRKIPLEGSLRDYFITDDNKFCWVVTNSPNQIVCLGIEDTTFKKSYNLDFTPWKAFYNYFNNRIYILAADLTTRKYIYVMNPGNGQIEKTIQMPSDNTNKQLFATDVAFGINGFGVITASNEYSDGAWVVIDSKQNDSIYMDSLDYGLYGFLSATTNYDKTKIIARQMGGNCRFGIIDCFTHSISILSTPASPVCYNSYITVNKLKDQIFVVNLQTTGYGQFMISNDIIVGSDTNFDAYNGSEADFSYRPGENNYIYYFDNHVFGIVNYNSGNVLMNTDFAYNLSNIASTTDGKYILCTDTNSIILFDTNIFYQNL